MIENTVNLSTDRLVDGFLKNRFEQCHRQIFPLTTGGYGPHPQRLPGLLSRVATPSTTRSYLPPQEGFSPGPLTPRFKHFPATRICPLPIVCFLCGTWHRAFMQKHCQLEEIINSLIKK